MSELNADRPKCEGWFPGLGGTNARTYRCGKCATCNAESEAYDLELRHAALLEAVRLAVDGNGQGGYPEIGINGSEESMPGNWHCEFCDEDARNWSEIPHMETCVVTKLRTLLAYEPTP